MRGAIKWFSQDKGYGFIRVTASEDRFFHISDLDGNQIPRVNDSVTFQPSVGKNGKPTATSVVIVSTYASSQSSSGRPTNSYRSSSQGGILKIEHSINEYLIVEGSFLRFFKKEGFFNEQWREINAINIRRIKYVQVDKQWSIFFGTQPYIKFQFFGIPEMHFNLTNESDFHVAGNIKKYIEQLQAIKNR